MSQIIRSMPFTPATAKPGSVQITYED